MHTFCIEVLLLMSFYHGLLLNGFLFAAKKKGLQKRSCYGLLCKCKSPSEKVYSDSLLSLILCLLIVNSLKLAIEHCSSLLSVIVKFV